MRTAFAKFFFLLFALLAPYTIFSQETEFISGRLLDATTNEPIVFASIHIKDRALGVISNTDGGFKIPKKYRDYGEILQISCMGYQNKTVLMQSLSDDKIHILKLEPGVLGLEEAVVTAKKKRDLLLATKIVQKAISAIPKNYANTSFSTIGYYRDYQREKEKYINLNEAIIEVFDSGFDQIDSTSSKYRLYEYKQNTDFGRDSLSDRPYDYIKYSKTIPLAYLPSYGGNEFVILRVHDAIRNFKINSYDFINNLEIDFINNHKFRKEDDTFYNDHYLYTIGFSKRLYNYRVSGKLYIAKRNFAIHKLEYSLYRNLIPGSSKKSKDENDLVFKIVNEYEEQYGKMYLNYISFHNNFTLRIPPVFKVDTMGIDLDKRSFTVEYNKKPDVLPAVHLSNYLVKFKKRRVKINRAQRWKNKVYLYPNMNSEEINEMIDEILEAERAGIDLNNLIEIKVSNVRDSLGNLVNEWTQKDFIQFREFFVQRVKSNLRAPNDELFMNKDRPIFMNQPMVRPKDFNDYWMNTPLQAIEN